MDSPTLTNRFKYLFTLGFGLWVTGASGQGGLLGKVFDSSNNKPLPGASVILRNLQMGTVTDDRGLFDLEAEWDDSDTLQISYLGYETVMINSGLNEFLHVGMRTTGSELQEVVVAAYQIGKKLMSAPGAVAVIPKREIDRGNQVLITPVLNRVPGIYMHTGALNTHRITIRGIGTRSLFSTNKVRAYLNQIPLTSGDGETTIEDIDLGYIDKIEVIKGPSASLYGAGLGGTINMESSKARYKQAAVEVDGMAGSYGLYRVRTRAYSSSDKANLNLSLGKVHSDGYRQNSTYDREFLQLLTQFYPSSKSEVSVLGNLIHVKGFIPSSIDSATFYSNPKAAAPAWARSMGFEEYDKGLLGISYLYEFNERLENTTALFSGFRNAFEPRPFNILKERSNNVGIRTKFAFSSGDRLKSKFIVGVEYFTEWYDWNTFENDNGQLGRAISQNQETRRYNNLFGQWDSQFGDRVQMSMGANLNQTSYDLTDLFVGDSLDQSGSYGFDPIFSPRVGLSVALSPDLSLYTNMSHGFSPPTLSETLTPDGLINPDIKPETGFNYEMGSRGKVVEKRLFYDISIYSMQVKNLLVAKRIGEDQFVGVNAGKTSHNGFESNLTYRLLNRASPSDRYLDLFLTYTYSDYKFKDFEDDGENFSGNQLTGSPKHVFNAGMDLAISGLYGNMNYQFVDQIPITDDNSIFSNSYDLLNLKLGYRRELGTNFRFDLYAGVNNITNRIYASMLLVNAVSFGSAPRYYYPGLPRNYYGGINLGLIINKPFD